jgi:ribulose-5-phosphate 4-epimerase/fuculose-1-phosphate aldolase
MVSEESVRAGILETVGRMRQEGLVVGTAGNVSARVPGAGQFWITPSGVDYRRLIADDLVCVDLAGGSVPFPASGGGKLKPSSDTANHAAIYRQRDDVAGIVHTHSTYATVFAVLRREIPALLVEAAGYLGGAVPVIEYLPPASPELGERAARGLGAHRAVLLPNHGVIAVGESVESAFTAALLVEQSARVAYLAHLLGEPAPIPPDEVERMHRFLHHEYGQRPASAGRTGTG